MSTEIHSLSGAYALDAVDDIERAQFEVHLRDCAECRDEVESMREVGALLGSAYATAPPPALRSTVLREIRSVRPLPPVLPKRHDLVEQRRRQAPRSSVTRWLTSAAAAVLLVAGGLVWHPWTGNTPAPVIDATSQVLHAPDAHSYTNRLKNGGVVTVTRSKSKGQAVVVATDLPAAPAGKVYEMWLLDSKGTPVPAGLLPAGDQQQVSQILSGSASTASGAAISIEPAGGSTKPTPPILSAYTFKA